MLASPSEILAGGSSDIAANVSRRTAVGTQTSANTTSASTNRTNPVRGGRAGTASSVMSSLVIREPTTVEGTAIVANLGGMRRGAHHDGQGPG
ncbi:hypothetical protein GCM10009682_08010 [Luedemannella flava]|uniref:Uncharacterized protein n=1 Tax=Luedemannella flava TaxID=349316 RepID=A0ABN2LI21_9ACTN